MMANEEIIRRDLGQKLLQKYFQEEVGDLLLRGIRNDAFV